MTDTYSNDDKIFRLTELYMSNTSDFKNLSAKEFANLYLKTKSEIEDVLNANLKAKGVATVTKRFNI